MRFAAGVLLAAGLGCSTRAPAPVAVDSSLARLIPADAVLLAGVRVRALRETTLYRKLEPRSGLRDLAGSLAKSGFDINKVDSLLIASDGVSTLALAKGRFPFTVPDSLSRTDYRGRTIYGSAENSFAAIDDSTAAAGSAASVRAAIDRAAAATRAGHPLLEAAARLPANSHLWAAGADLGALAGRYIPREGNAANARRLLQSTKRLLLAADFTAGAKASITAACANEKDARLLNDTLRGLLGLARLSVPDGRKELLRIYDGVKVERKDLEIRVEIDEPPELLDKLIETFAPAITPAGAAVPSIPRRT